MAAMKTNASRSVALVAVLASACATMATSTTVDSAATVAPPSAVASQDPATPPSELRARLEVDTHRESFTVRLFLANTGNSEQQLVHGHGHGGLGVVPQFRFGRYTIDPPRYLVPPSRAMRPDFTVVGAGKEVLYGSWTLGYPPAGDGPRELTATIGFREAKLTLTTPPVMLAAPAAKEGR